MLLRDGLRGARRGRGRHGGRLVLRRLPDAPRRGRAPRSPRSARSRAEPWPARRPSACGWGCTPARRDARTATTTSASTSTARRASRRPRHGGQVLLSEATRALVGRTAARGVTLRDLGEHRLKDLDAPERLYQLVDRRACRTTSRRSRSARRARTTCPRRLTSFVGREREIAEVRRLLERRAAADADRPRRDRQDAPRRSGSPAELARSTSRAASFFVELSPIADPELIAPAIAQALGLARTPARPRRATARATHLARSARAARPRQLRAGPRGAPRRRRPAARRARPRRCSPRVARSLHVSRRAGVPGAAARACPTSAHLPRLERAVAVRRGARCSSSVRAAVQPDFAVTNENAPAVAEICARLDGLPLAIELAAARIKLLAPAGDPGAARAAGCRLLTSGARDLPARQQTLRGAIAWSHDLLDEPERRAVRAAGRVRRRLHVWRRPRRSAIRPASSALDVLDGLGVARRQEPRPPGRERRRRAALRDARDDPRVRARAADRASDGSRRCAPARARISARWPSRPRTSSWAPRRRSGSNRLDEEHDNLRAALQWFVESGRAEAALHTAFVLWRFWQMRGHLAEGVDRVQAALAMPHAADHPAALADAYSAIAGLTYWQGNADESRAGTSARSRCAVSWGIRPAWRRRCTGSASRGRSAGWRACGTRPPHGSTSRRR